MSTEVISEVSTGITVVGDDARKQMLSTIQGGEAMAKLTLMRESAYLELKLSGRIKPATILNFNPQCLVVEDGLIRWKIPAATDFNKKCVSVDYKGKKYAASVFTVREPQFYAKIRDVKAPVNEEENAIADRDPKFVMPLEMLDQYKRNYTVAGNLNMGGVIVFEGDIHAFTKGQKTIRVPRFSQLPDRTRSYYSEEVDVEPELQTALETQKNFCLSMLEQGNQLAQTEEDAKNISFPHRIWAQYSLTMGWTQVSPAWTNPSLESETACKGCGKGKTRNGAWFCSCGRPYDAYSAFMAGEHVAESYLFALKDKELNDVMKELERREQLKARFKIKA